jgi:outer membrane protein assembly factor BamD
LLAGLTVAASFTLLPALRGQNPAAPQDVQASPQTTTQVGGTTVTGSSQTSTDAQGHPQASATIGFSNDKKKTKVPKSDRLQQSKDTKAAEKKDKKLDPLVGKDATLPDKQLYDKALAQEKSGHFDVARLDLQTLLNTYPDSQYQMRAKLAVADAWYKEGGAAALTQAEQEYKDFITFFPNVPEAAEAQLRVGDIYFKQMDIPDRDYEKGMHAEAEYRTMLKQYPDAPKALLDETRQKLREVQEVLATREAQLGAFYASHNNWAASIARYQTVIDTYPLYSHMDDVLIGVGDAYEAQANNARAAVICTPTNILTTPCLSEAAKATLLTEYDGKAAKLYREVVLNHSAAPHVEDAKERLAGMGLPIPVPTPAQVAASEALEGSRAQYNLQRRLAIFFLHKPDTVTAAQIGDPPLDDAPPTYAPAVAEAIRMDYVHAFQPVGESATHTPAPAAPAAEAAPAAAAPAAPAAPLALSDVAPAEGNGSMTNSKTVTISPVSGGSSAPASGSSLGVEVLGSGTGDTTPEAAPRSTVNTPPSDLPAATGKQDPNFGLPSATPNNSTALPAIEKPAEAPDQVNDTAGQTQPAIVQATDRKGKPVKEKLDKTDESSSKKKPKKGLDKLNPFDKQ